MLKLNMKPKTLLTAFAAGLMLCSAAQAETFVAQLMPTAGHEGLAGQVVFQQVAQGAGVSLVAEVTGLPANSTHGFHVHEFGDCRAADATSAGGHFNPAQMPHGAPTEVERHLGDLGNLQSDAAGVAKLSVVDGHLAMSGPHSILGRAVIVHIQADDLISQPVGNAGARVLCGVIGVAKAP